MGRKKLSDRERELSRIRTAERKLKWQQNSRVGKQMKTFYYVEDIIDPSAKASAASTEDQNAASTTHRSTLLV